MDVQYKSQKENVAIVSLDESFFFYDSLARRVWIEEGKIPVVRITGSHKHSCLFGAISMKGKQVFRQYYKFNSDTFLDFLKIIHHKFPKCYLFMDKASISSLQVKEGKKLPRTKQGHTHPRISTNSITGVYDTGGSMEYS